MISSLVYSLPFVQLDLLNQFFYLARYESLNPFHSFNVSILKHGHMTTFRLADLVGNHVISTK